MTKKGNNTVNPKNKQIYKKLLSDSIRLDMIFL